MFYIYLLESKRDRELYIGYTKDLRKRLLEHNQGLNTSTKHQNDWKCIYYEACVNQHDAKRREKYFKTSQGTKMLKRRIKDYLYHRKHRRFAA